MNIIVENFEQILDKVFEMQQDSDEIRGYQKPIFTHMGKLMEEMGEFSEQMLMLDGYKTNDINEREINIEAKKEIIDMLIMVLVLAHQMKMTKPEILTLVAEKLTKWQKKHIDPLGTSKN